jgi:iron(III) transport system ATP-binding protein
VTTVCVTHSWLDAVELCERMAVMVAGRLVQEGTVDELFWSPACDEVALLTGPIVEISPSLLATGRVICEPEGAGFPARPPEPASRRLVRPQQLEVVERAENPGWRVTGCEIHAVGWLLTVACDGQRLRVPSCRPLPIGRSVGLRLLADPPSAREAERNLE